MYQYDLKPDIDDDKLLWMRLYTLFFSVTKDGPLVPIKNAKQIRASGVLLDYFEATRPEDSSEQWDLCKECEQRIPPDVPTELENHVPTIISEDAHEYMQEMWKAMLEIGVHPVQAKQNALVEDFLSGLKPLTKDELRVVDAEVIEEAESGQPQEA